ncbi:MAG TPA: hypothetical protein VLA31_08830 [Burkholderiaceae bacterium]|nr:hypothetical protein [Burkholderiaceae bacterium]
MDSRYAMGSGGSSILYEIPGGVELGPNARCFVSEFTCVCAWATIDETNRHQVVHTSTGLYALAIPVGSYDLDSFANALQTALVQEVAAGFVVERAGVGSTGSTQQLLRVRHPSISFVLAESPLSKIVSFAQVSATNHVSGFVDLRRCHSIFVHSPSFGNYNTVGPGGVRTALCKIPVEVGYGGLVRWSTGGSSFDCIECGVRSLHVLRLELKDADGNLLDLAGTAFSMTLLFSDGE